PSTSRGSRGADGNPVDPSGPKQRSSGRCRRQSHLAHYPTLSRTSVIDPDTTHEVGSIRKGAFREFERQGCCDHSATGMYLCAVPKSALPERTDAPTSATGASTNSDERRRVTEIDDGSPQHLIVTSKWWCCDPAPQRQVAPRDSTRASGKGIDSGAL